MRFKVVSLLAAAVSLGVVQVASAADMPVKGPIYKAPPAAYNWTGCYVGGNVGGAWSRSNVDIPNYPASVNINASSVIGGAQVGCNYTFAPQWVIGGEVDWDFTSLNGDTLTTLGTERFFTKWNQLGTARARLGYAWDRWLVYATGGGAWSRLSAANYTPSCGANCASDKSAWYGGWAAGVGAEYAFTANWIVGLEYLHAGFGRKNFVYNGPTNINNRIDVVRARLSYKF